MRLIISRERLINYFGLAAGLGTMLYLPTPFGRVAIFDLISYFAFFLLIGKWHTLSKPQRTIVYLSLVWVFSAILSNIMNDVPIQVNLKSSMIVFNVTCMLVCSFILLNKSKEAFVWFIVGNGISGVLSFYIFPNGALLYFAQAAGYSGGNLADYLLEKQVYPTYISAIVKSVLFPLALSTSLSMVIINLLVLISGFFLLSLGSRSSFGIFAFTSILGLLYVFSRRTIDKIVKRLGLALLFFISIGYLVVYLYGNLAESGTLGIEEKKKYEAQFEESGLGLIGGRNELLYTSRAIVKRPLFGLGANRHDNYGIIESVSQNNGSVPREIYFTKQIPAHSILMGAWVENGLGGGIFWIYVMLVLVRFLREIPAKYPRYFPFLIYLYIGFGWAILFSPFGGARGLFCMLIALAVLLLEDNKTENVRLFLK